jgi:hypothetical protein
MRTSPFRLQLLPLISSLVIASCGTSTHAARPSGAANTSGAVQAPLPEPAGGGLYAPDEALRDALSSPLEHVGTGQWHGSNRTTACAFRNQRVLIVNVYCTLTETQAFRIDVFSPTRGRVRIYAEAKGTVSSNMRQNYFTFMAESEPPPRPETYVPPLTLTMSFQQLQTYEERRYSAYLPACYGGVELQRPKGGCLGALQGHSSEWTTRNRSFLDYANADWYQVVRQMRALATRYGGKESE